MTSNQITIALTKGRIEKDTVKLLEKAGFDMSFMADKGRNLIFESPDKRFRFLLVKAPDVTTYVRHGVADIGIVGKDVLVEHPTGYLEMLDLNFGLCKFSEHQQKTITLMTISVNVLRPSIQPLRRIILIKRVRMSKSFRFKGVLRLPRHWSSRCHCRYCRNREYTCCKWPKSL